jgi:hypothetical protein
MTGTRGNPGAPRANTSSLENEPHRATPGLPPGKALPAKP